MRMFQPVSRHSRELSIANHSSEQTASQLKYVSDVISNWLENHQPQKAKIFTVTKVSFLQNSNQMASRLTVTTSFPKVLFQLLQYLKQRPRFSAHRAALITKNSLAFPAFSLRFVVFAAQFCFGCKVLFPRSDALYSQVLAVAWFSCTNHNSLLRITTNEITSFCIDNILPFFVFTKVAEGRHSVMLKYFQI